MALSEYSWYHFRRRPVCGGSNFVPRWFRHHSDLRRRDKLGPTAFGHIERPFQHRLDHACGNSLLVAVRYSGTNGTVVTSTDGVNWLQRQLETHGHLFGITYGNNQFVAVGGDLLHGPGTILTSSDGTNWVQRQSG